MGWKPCEVYKENMRRLVVADLKSNNNSGVCTGHYYALAANYQDFFGSLSDVKIAGGPIYLKRFKRDDILLLPNDFIAGQSKMKNFFRMLGNAKTLFRHVGKDDVVVIQQSQPAMILLVLLLTYFGNTNLYQIQYSDEPMRRPLFRFAMCFFRSKLRGLICPNDSVGKAYGVPYIAVPDYLYVERESFERVSGYAKKKYDFAIVGRIAEDKGVAEAVRAFVGKSCSLIVAGQAQIKSEEESVKKSASESSNIQIKLDYISDCEYDEYICESRYCILNYQGSYAERSSGVVLDTLFRGVPVVGKRCRALQFIEDYGLGVLYDNVNDLDFSQLLDESFYNKCVKSISVYQNHMKQLSERLLDFLRLRGDFSDGPN